MHFNYQLYSESLKTKYIILWQRFNKNIGYIFTEDPKSIKDMIKL